MLSKLIFFAAVILATVAVMLLAILSPLPHKKTESAPQNPSLALSIYIQQTKPPNPSSHPLEQSGAGALVFHRALTEGPESTSRVIGKAQGFIIPIEKFARSGFNVIYLTIDTWKYSGSVTIQANQLGKAEKKELVVVGGTGSFAFARGLAVFSPEKGQGSDLNRPYQISLHLKFPNTSRAVPG